MFKIPTKSITGAATAFVACAALQPTDANDFVSPGDEAIRHHLSYLADADLIPTLLTTWPLNSHEVQRALNSVSAESLSPAQLQSLEAASALLSHPANAPSGQFFARVGNSHEELRGFASDSRERNEAGFSARQSFESGIFGKLTLSVAQDDFGNWDTRWDNSYLALDWKGWTLGAGRIDRWWGPGWQSSIILSNNARPSPGVFLQRSESTASVLPVLRWFGPWSVSAFANQLESDRHVPDAKLLGLRAVFNPTRNLEIGLSRTAQWGGDGRPENLESFWNLVIGKDNVGQGGIDKSNEPGNQLGGIDWRWSTRIGDIPFALYGQIIGEDEAGGLPSRELGMFGIEFPLTVADTHGRIFVEASDSMMRFWDDPMPNSAYNHSIYQSGYRYYGRAIGASSDNDSRTLTIGGFHDFSDLGAVTWKAIYASLNRDGVTAGNQVAPQETDALVLSLDYTKAVSEDLKLSLGGYHSTETLSPLSNFSNTGVSARITLNR